MQRRAIGETIGGCGTCLPTVRCRGSRASAWAAGDFRDTVDNDDQRHQPPRGEDDVRTDFARALRRSGRARRSEADPRAVRGVAAGLPACRADGPYRAAAARPGGRARPHLRPSESLRPAMDPTQLTIAEASEAIQSARLSPVALTEAYLDRIAALDGELHSYVLVLHDEALAAARARAHDASRGPLHGVPIGLKDIY